MNNIVITPKEELEKKENGVPERVLMFEATLLDVGQPPEVLEKINAEVTCLLNKEREHYALEKQALLKALHPFVWVYKTAVKKRGKIWVDALDYITLGDFLTAIEVYERYAENHS